MAEVTGSSGAPGAPWSVRVRAARGGATVYARAHSYEVGSPLPFDVEEGRVSALEYAIGALGAEVVNGFAALARRRRLEIDDVEATVEATLDNPLTHLGVVGESGHPGIERISMRVHVATLEAEEKVRSVWEEALRRSPLVRTLEDAVDLDLRMTVTV
jgi:hypothetical protein